MVRDAVNILFTVMEYAILVRVFISWIPMPRDNQFMRILYQVTEPILGPVRSIMNRSSFVANSMIDFSPIVAFLLISVVRNIVLSLL